MDAAESTSVDQDAMRVANRYAAQVEKAETLQGRARACRDAADRYRSDARTNQESAENHQMAARTIRDPHIAVGHARVARDAEAEAAREILAARHYEAQADQYEAQARGTVHAEETAVATTPPSGPSTGAKNAVADRLRMAGRMVLRDGEQVVASGSVTGADGALVLGAAVDTPAGRHVHLAVPINPEDKAAWRGGHAPPQETTVDEDGDECTIDTGADATVVLDAADVARLPAVIEDVIARGVEADKQHRQVTRDYHRLYAERVRLEGHRYPGRGREKIDLDELVRQHERNQERRRRDVERAVERLSPADRAVYDERQRQIDAAGRDAWAPGKEAEAAEVCGLTVDEYREMRELDRIPYQQRAKAQDARLDQLKHGGGTVLHPSLPPLLAEQAALVCGLTVDEYREMEALERIPKRHRDEYYNRGRRVRTDAEQARLDELDASTRGATGATQRATYKLRGAYLSMLKTHHSARADLADARAAQAQMAATARPIDPTTAEELERVTADLDAISARFDEMAGEVSASAEIPARNGGALVVEALQQEDGGVQYRVDRKPPDANEDWIVGFSTDPYTATPSGLRKVGKLACGLAEAGRAADR